MLLLCNADKIQFVNGKEIVLSDEFRSTLLKFARPVGDFDCIASQKISFEQNWSVPLKIDS